MADREAKIPAPVSAPTCLAPFQAPHLQLALAYCMPLHAMQAPPGCASQLATVLTAASRM